LWIIPTRRVASRPWTYGLRETCSVGPVGAFHHLLSIGFKIKSLKIVFFLGGVQLTFYKVKRFSRKSQFVKIVCNFYIELCGTDWAVDSYVTSAKLAGSMGASALTVTSYVDLFKDLLLVRKRPPFHANVKMRLVKLPKVYVRDSGLLHALLGIRNHDDLLGHSVAGASWKSFVILLTVISLFSKHYTT